MRLNKAERQIQGINNVEQTVHENNKIIQINLELTEVFSKMPGVLCSAKEVMDSQENLITATD